MLLMTMLAATRTRALLLLLTVNLIVEVEFSFDAYSISRLLNRCFDVFLVFLLRSFQSLLVVCDVYVESVSNRQ